MKITQLMFSTDTGEILNDAFGTNYNFVENPSGSAPWLATDTSLSFDFGSGIAAFGAFFNPSPIYHPQVGFCTALMSCPSVNGPGIGMLFTTASGQSPPPFFGFAPEVFEIGTAKLIPVPEPSPLFAGMLTAMIGMGYWRHRQRRSGAAY